MRDPDYWNAELYPSTKSCLIFGLKSATIITVLNAAVGIPMNGIAYPAIPFLIGIFVLVFILTFLMTKFA